jgi:hypothetical protein
MDDSDTALDMKKLDDRNIINTMNKPHHITRKRLGIRTVQTKEDRALCSELSIRG